MRRVGKYRRKILYTLLGRLQESESQWSKKRVPESILLAWTIIWSTVSPFLPPTVSVLLDDDNTARSYALFSISSADFVHSSAHTPCSCNSNSFDMYDGRSFSSGIVTIITSPSPSISLADWLIGWHGVLLVLYALAYSSTRLTIRGAGVERDISCLTKRYTWEGTSPQSRIKPWLNFSKIIWHFQTNWTWKWGGGVKMNHSRIYDGRMERHIFYESWLPSACIFEENLSHTVSPA